MKRLKGWLLECRFLRIGARRLQRAQLEEHERILGEVRRGKEDTLHDLADAVMRLEAVSDRLEQTILDMGDEADE